ncbi:single-stranded DNA-binding protein [candidate division KSB1 bacterium]|nr:single-stranded DNA-binding protein [candidate division KSB1 bacterium]
MQESSEQPDGTQKMSAEKAVKGYVFPNINRVAIAGVLVQDPPLRYTTRGVPVTNFVIITDPEECGDSLEGMERLKCYISVVVWAQQAVQCNKYLRKGNPVLIIGELQSMPNFEPDRNYFPIQINAQWIQYLERGGGAAVNTIFEKEDNES